MRRTRSALSCLAALGALAATCGSPQAQDARGQNAFGQDPLDPAAAGLVREAPETARLRRALDAAASAAAPASAEPARPSRAGASGRVARRTPAATQRVAAPQPVPAGRPERPKWRQNQRAFDEAITAAAARRARVEADRYEALGVSAAETAEPFDPLGIRAGSFVLRPAIETSLGTDSNPLRTTTGRTPSAFQRYVSELSVRSDWTRHALDADIRGAFTKYDNVSGNNRPELFSRLRGRVDVSERTRAELEGRYLLTTESAGNPDAPTGVVRPPPVITAGGTLGLVHRWNRLEMALRGSFDRTTYDNAQLRGGGILDRSDRDYNQPAVKLRVGYEIRPGIRPFIEGQLDTRHFDREVDYSGYMRQSDGRQIKAGTSFEMGRTLTGEASAGWLVRQYEDPRLQDISGLLVDGLLVWRASGLTTVRLGAATTVEETTYDDTTGVFKRDLGAAVEHAFRRWLIGTARFGWGFDDYGQSGRRDDRFVLSGLVTAKLSREWWLTGEARQEQLTSNQPGNDYTANIVMVGLRFQR